MTRARWIASVAGGTLVAALVLGLRSTGALEGAELALYDRLVRYAGGDAPDTSPILLVEITEQDILEQGHWPISDREIAKTLVALERAGVRAVGIDLYRNLPAPPGESFLRRLLRDQPNVVAVRKFGDRLSPGIPGPPALEGGDRVGFNDLVLDRDETVRRALLYMDDGSTVDVSFALRLALVALAADGITPQPDPSSPEWLRLGPTTIPPIGSDHGGYADVDAAGYQFLLDYAAAEIPAVRLGEVLRDEIDASRLRDKVVLIGSNAKSLPDRFEVPFGGSRAGVAVHAHAVHQLLRFARGLSAPLRVLTFAQEAAVIWAVAVLGCLLGTSPGLGRYWTGAVAPVAAALAGMLAVTLLSGVAYRAGLWVPIAAPALAFALAVGIATAWLSSRERAERAELMRIFSRHVSSDVANELWRQRRELFSGGRLEPRRLTATVLFLDMKGYSAQSEKMEPGVLMEWVNDFMSSMAYQVDVFGGVVDDYFGDGLKADFGVPIPRSTPEEIARDARSAVACALAMREELARLNAHYRASGRPEVAMRIGIHTGPVVAGSLGSDERLKYTVVGDVVVTAQRLEATDAVAHDFERAPCRILVSDRTRSLLDTGFETEPLGGIALPGRAETVPVHRVLGREDRGGP